MMLAARRWVGAVGTEKVACVYALMLRGAPVYVGKTGCLAERLKSHKAQKTFDGVLFIASNGRKASALERAMVRTLRPKLNVALPSKKSARPGEYLSDLVNVRVATDVRERLEAAAKESGLPFSAWVRVVVLREARNTIRRHKRSAAEARCEFCGSALRAKPASRR